MPRPVPMKACLGAVENRLAQKRAGVDDHGEALAGPREEVLSAWNWADGRARLCDSRGHSHQV